MRARRPTYAALSLACVASLALGSACDDHVRAQPDAPAELIGDIDTEPELSPEPGPPPAIGPVLTLDEEAAKLEAALNSTCEPLLQLADSTWEPCRSADGWALPLAPVSIWGRSSTELWVGGNGTMLREGEAFRCAGTETIGKIEGNEKQVWARTERWQNDWPEPIVRWEQDQWVDSGRVANSVRVGPGDAVWFVSDGVVSRELDGELTTFPSELEAYDVVTDWAGGFWLAGRTPQYAQAVQRWSGAFERVIGIHRGPWNLSDLALGFDGALWVALGEGGELGVPAGALFKVDSMLHVLDYRGYRALSVGTDNAVWAVGGFGFYTIGDETGVQAGEFGPNREWMSNELDFRDVWVNDRSDVWVAAFDLGVLHVQGSRWSRHGPSPASLISFGMWRNRPLEVFGREIESSQELIWSLCDNLEFRGFSVTLYGPELVDAAIVRHVIPAGPLYLATFDGASWHVHASLPVASPVELRRLGGDLVVRQERESGAVIWLVKDEKASPIFEASQWDSRLVTLAGSSSADLWIGDGTQLHHWDGLAWSVSELPGVDAISGLEQLGELGLYLLAHNGAVLRYQGGEWVALGRDGAAPSTVLRAIVARAADDLWVGGDDGVYHWDGQRWTHEDAGGAVDGLWLAEDRIYARVDGRLSWKELGP